MKHLITLLCLMASMAAFATPKEEYELQERCGLRAEKWFKGEYGGGIQNTKDGQAMVSYRNHYNIKMNRCLVLVNYQSIPYKDKTQHPMLQRNLFDINEGKDFATFSVFTDSQKVMDCSVGTQRCTDQDDWEALIAPIMGD